MAIPLCAFLAPCGLVFDANPPCGSSSGPAGSWCVLLPQDCEMQAFIRACGLICPGPGVCVCAWDARVLDLPGSLLGLRPGKALTRVYPGLGIPLHARVPGIPRNRVCVAKATCYLIVLCLDKTKHIIQKQKYHQNETITKQKRKPCCFVL